MKNPSRSTPLPPASMLWLVTRQRRGRSIGEHADLTVRALVGSWALQARPYVRDLTTMWVRNRIAILTWGVGIPLATAAAWFVSHI